MTVRARGRRPLCLLASAVTPPTPTFVIFDLRPPRLVTGIACGAVLGASGAIFQTITRNPLGSPYFIGLTAGASTGALIAILLLGGGVGAAGAGALIGCFVASGLMYALAYSHGAQGYRLILVGIGVGRDARGVQRVPAIRARLDEARNAQLWLYRQP